MKKVFFSSLLLGGLLSASSCASDEPTTTPPQLSMSAIVSLEFKVGEQSCPVSFQTLPSGKLSDTMLLSVEAAADKAVVKSYAFTSTDFSLNVREGDEVSFVNNLLALTLSNGAASMPCYVKMVAEGGNAAARFLYIVKTSDKDLDGLSYFLDEDKAAKVYAVSDSAYEGYVDLSGTNWDNLGLVKPDRSAMYEQADGWGLAAGQSYCAFTLTEKQMPEGSLHFSTLGPWGDWAHEGFSCVWKINFNEASRVVDLLAVKLGIAGTAVGAEPLAMTYTSATQTWSITANLSAGALRVATIPIAAEDPTLSYGGTAQTLSASAPDINIAAAGSYTIKVYLSILPYSYELTKNN